MPRTHELDNLRTALTVLVILHHASIPYGGLGSWPYKPSNPPDTFSTIFTATFNVVNQTFFMAMFFLLSGYFSAVASETRTPSTFLQEKWKRLGVPCIVYSLLGPGINEGIIAVFQNKASLKTAIARATTKICGARGARGPVWYCAVLLVFDSIYVATYYPHTPKSTPTTPHLNSRSQNKTQTSSLPRTSHLSLRTISTGLSLAAISAFLLRTSYPIGTTFTPLGLQFGFLPQYILYYATGIYARSHLQTELHRLVPRSSVRLPLHLNPLLCATLVLILLVHTFAIYQVFFQNGNTLDERSKMAFGGWNSMAVWYAFFNEVMGFVISVWVLRVFVEGRWARKKWVVRGVDVARWSYAAFLVHAPVVVMVQCLVGGWDVGGVVKSGVVGTLGGVGSWVVGWRVGKALEGVGAKG